MPAPVLVGEDWVAAGSGFVYRSYICILDDKVNRRRRMTECRGYTSKAGMVGSFYFCFPYHSVYLVCNVVVQSLEVQSVQNEALVLGYL